MQYVAMAGRFPLSYDIYSLLEHGYIRSAAWAHFCPLIWGEFFWCCCADLKEVFWDLSLVILAWWLIALHKAIVVSLSLSLWACVNVRLVIMTWERYKHSSFQFHISNMCQKRVSIYLLSGSGFLFELVRWLLALPCRNICAKLGCRADRSNHQSDLKCIFIFIVWLPRKQNTKCTALPEVWQSLREPHHPHHGRSLFSSAQNLSSLD